MAICSEEKVSSKKYSDTVGRETRDVIVLVWSNQSKDFFYRYCERVVVSGNKTRFWEDVPKTHTPRMEKMQ
jgi:hypothetical protein